MTLDCIAVDDEPLALELIMDYVQKIPDLNLVASCSDALEAGAILRERHIDLVFIDIQMPAMSGLQFIESLQNKPMFILITAYEKFALEGYSLNVLDYLLKPLELDRFIQACNKAFDLYHLRHRSSNSPLYDFIFVNVGYLMVKLVFSDILWIEGYKDYIKIFLCNQKQPLIVRMTLKSIEDKLPNEMFMRVHKSFLVSILKVTSYKKAIICINEKELPVGDTYRHMIEKRFEKS